MKTIRCRQGERGVNEWADTGRPGGPDSDRLSVRGRILDSFFSTLAQITATSLAVIIAGFAAYVVFLQERAAQFDERIAQQRVEIRETLVNLRTEWPWLQWPYLPPEFAAAYRSQHPTSARVDLTIQAGLDLLFDLPQLKSALNEVQNPWTQDCCGTP